MTIQVSANCLTCNHMFDECTILSTAGTNEETITIANPTSADEEASLLSTESGPGDMDLEHEGHKSLGRSHHSLSTDITGFQLLRKSDFWLLFLMLGLLTGIGLMTINNIGNDVSFAPLIA